MHVEAARTELTQFELSKAITISKLFSKIKLSPSSRLVLRCLVDHWNNDKGYCFPKQNKIAEETGCSRKSVNDAISELRSKGLIFTNGEKGESLKYYLTNNFFDLIEVSHGGVKNAYGCVKISHHEQIKEKKENKSFSNEKRKFSGYKQSVEGIKIPSANETIQRYKDERKTACTPLDFSKEQQLEYYNKLPDFAKNGFYAQEIKKRWKLSN